MNPTELRLQENFIKEYIDRFSATESLNPELRPIYDGVADETKYCASKYRIAWMLKEPYDENDGTGGGWSLTKDILSQDSLYPDIMKNRPSFHVMAYITHAILNEINAYNEMDYISNNPEIAQSLNNIAIINVNKMPAYSKSNDKELEIRYNFWKPILHWQLKVYKPNIIIFCNTFHLYENDIELADVKKGDIDCCQYIWTGKELLIDAYHPSQTTINRDRYINSIIEAKRKFF